MADISKEVNDFREARLGEDVRGSLISLAEKVNTEVETNTVHVDDAADRVNRTAQAVEETNQEAIEAVNHANQITEEYKQYADTKLEETTEQRRLAEAAKQGADSSASLAESWAHGNTGARPEENTDNASYWSQQSKTDADRAKEEADRASQYSQITAPDFYLDIETGALYQKGGAGVDFVVADAILYWKIVA